MIMMEHFNVKKKKKKKKEQDHSKVIIIVNLIIQWINQHFNKEEGKKSHFIYMLY